MLLHHLPISTLHPDPANARLHDDRNLAALKSSLARFGQQKPIVIDANNVVRAGNGTLAAAKSLGWSTIAAVRSDLPPIELTAYAIADNRTAELAEWDDEILSTLAREGLLDTLGFSPEEIAQLTDQEETNKDDDRSPALNSVCEVVIECEDEDQQQELFDRLTAEGLTCRLFTL